MRVTRSKVAVISDLSIDEDLDFGGSYQCGDLASPASGEALRKGNKDIANAEIALNAAITPTKIAGTAVVISILTQQGDMLTRNGSVLKRFAKGTAGHYLKQGANEPEWATLPIVIKVKPDDETVNNSDTLQDDDDLILPVAIDSIWVIDLFTRSTAHVTGDIKIQFSVPSNAVIHEHENGEFANMNTLRNRAASSATDQVGSTDALAFWWIRYLYVGGDTAGNVILQWAQNAAHASDTVMKAGSFLLCTKIA